MTDRPVSLPMYDADREAVNAWWRALARAMRSEGVEGVPPTLEWPEDLDAHWHDPSLLLSQTCGYPLVTHLSAAAQVVGAFRYTVTGCTGIAYRSELVVRHDDATGTLESLRGRVAVINDRHSHSGSNALRALVAPLADEGRFFGRWLVSGSHRKSIEAVRRGLADVASIDCVTLAALRQRHDDILQGLHILGSTPPAPGLPLVTAATTSTSDLEGLRRALAIACADSALASIRSRLFIGGFEVAEAADWQPIEDIRQRTVGLLD